MKIAIVLNTSWNIYNFRLGLVRSLINEGHEIVAVAPYDDYSPKLKELGIGGVFPGGTPFDEIVAGIQEISL